MNRFFDLYLLSWETLRQKIFSSFWSLNQPGFWKFKKLSETAVSMLTLTRCPSLGPSFTTRVKIAFRLQIKHQLKNLVRNQGWSFLFRRNNRKQFRQKLSRVKSAITSQSNFMASVLRHLSIEKPLSIETFRLKSCEIPNEKFSMRVHVCDRFWVKGLGQKFWPRTKNCCARQMVCNCRKFWIETIGIETIGIESIGTVKLTESIEENLQTHSAIKNLQATK